MTIDLAPAAVDRRCAGLATDLDDRAALDARMIWSALVEPGDGVAGRLVRAYGARAALEVALGLRAPRGDTEVTPDELRAAQARWTPRVRDAEEPSNAARRARVMPLTPESAAWPRRLDDLGEHAPLCLWVRGEPARLSPQVAVAMVGARAATGYGEVVVGEIAGDLATQGATIVSGGAYGIDGAAHRATIAVGGQTVAWLAGGVDRPYPSGHAGLLDRIVSAGGAIASEVPCGSAPTKWRFLARNRLIAAGADGTVVVEAGWRSGSLNTAGHAASLGRPLGAVPGPVTSAASAGCHRLLREYDARCVTCADDVRELVGIETSPTLFDTGPSGGGTSGATRLRDALSTRTPRSLDDIARRAGMSVDEARAGLGLLALAGYAESGEAGWRANIR